MEQQQRLEGVVKFFNSAKGWGFITSQTGEDLFVHYSAIRFEGFKSLEEGQSVRFDVQPSPKGPQAGNVEIL